MKLPLVYQDIIGMLPHRYPFLLVDTITELEPGKRAVGVKNVTSNEPFFQGHFPGNPIMPGVLVVEAMAQVGGVLAHLAKPDSEKEGKPSMFFFAAIDKVKFRKSVIPGDQLIIKVEALRTGSKFWKMAGKVFVKDDLVAQGELVATVS
jgi:beta-hydroxyacyl-ACP dehydratase FabZ